MNIHKNATTSFDKTRIAVCYLQVQFKSEIVCRLLVKLSPPRLILAINVFTIAFKPRMKQKDNKMYASLTETILYMLSISDFIKLSLKKIMNCKISTNHFKKPSDKTKR